MKKIAITVASFFIITGIMTNEVHAEEDFKMELYTIDTELDSLMQNYVEGTEEQLSNVDEKSMKFIKNIAFDAHLIGNDYGIYPSIIIAQAVLESGNGESELASEPNYNLFGMKGSYNGEYATMLTKEDDGSGYKYTINANFKKYPDISASLQDHGKLLREGLDGYYSGTWRENAKSPKEAADYLQGRYATDTKYSSKLMSIINNYNLERFDKILSDRDLAWLSSNSLDPWELPIVDDFKVKDLRAWGSSLNEIIREISEVDDNEKGILNNYNKHYVEEYLGLTFDVFNINGPRYTRIPNAGDIAIYNVQNNHNEMIERYAIVEGLKDDSLFISEGVKGKSGLYIIYRAVPKSSLSKFEFISIKDLKESFGSKPATIGFPGVYQ